MTGGRPVKMVFGPVTAALFAELPRAQAGWLVKAMLSYAETGEAPAEIPPRHLAAWIAVREELAQAERRSAARAEAGRAGGSKPKQTEANGSKRAKTASCPPVLAKPQAEASKPKQTGKKDVLLACASENASKRKQTQANGETAEKPRVSAGFSGVAGAEAPLARADAHTSARAGASSSDPIKERIDSYPESDPSRVLGSESESGKGRAGGEVGIGLGIGSDRNRDVPTSPSVALPAAPSPSLPPAPVPVAAAKAPSGPSAAPCGAGGTAEASAPARTPAALPGGILRPGGRNPGNGGEAMHREWTALAAAAESPYAVLAQVRDAMLPEFAAWSCMEGHNTRAIAVYRKAMRSLTPRYFRRILEEFLGECNTPGGEPESRGRAFMARIVSALRDVREQERAHGDRTLPLPMTIPAPQGRETHFAAPPQEEADPPPLPLAANQS